MERLNRYIGVDVQAARGCAFAVLDELGRSVESGWLGSETGRDAAEDLRNLVGRHVEAVGSVNVAVGIDAPRRPLDGPRQWYWDGAKLVWRQRRVSDRGNGRHCEVVVSAHRIANPQWTPHARPFPEWMDRGFALFAEIVGVAATYEVFPSASYTLLNTERSVILAVCLSSFAHGPKDMLDAYVSAATVREFIEGRGQAIGGGDGQGEIILPRPLPRPIEQVLKWPPKGAIKPTERN
ncbi:MAG: hypothetical protein ABIJ57_03665 [Pseudomonadota bacterium]